MDQNKNNFTHFHRRKVHRLTWPASASRSTEFNARNRPQKKGLYSDTCSVSASVCFVIRSTLASQSADRTLTFRILETLSSSTRWTPTSTDWTSSSKRLPGGFTYFRRSGDCEAAREEGDEARATAASPQKYWSLSLWPPSSQRLLSQTESVH